ncbi:MAG: fused response regulator/phosphatase [Spirochaetes bacterium]|nr:fused response regulator/phosphatase [Spirochaetota bacterium]
MHKKILIIEDNDLLRQSIAAFLELSGYKTIEANDGSSGIELFISELPDLIITDLNMPKLSGKDVIRKIAEKNDEIPIIVLSGEGNIYEAIQAMQLGAWDYIIKPVYELQILIHSINKVNERARLLRKNREYRENLENAKKIMENDLKMAINVQKVYFPQKPPASNEWDVAFKSLPMAGVSGDFYDFYEQNGKLTGISLFDVSGHGIASALITMIAKSAAYRCFKEMHDKPLNEVIEFINSELISEIDVMNYYLTGVMLKFQDDNVEYVNAAHPTMLHYSSTSDTVLQPESDSAFRNGCFIGISIFQMCYEVHKFKVEKDDSIIIYSDCLIEAENAEGERYGLERLLKTFKSVSKNNNAGKIINLIMNDFYGFLKTDKLHDDLTIVVLKRK